MIKVFLKYFFVTKNILKTYVLRLCVVKIKTKNIILIEISNNKVNIKKNNNKQFMPDAEKRSSRTSQNPNSIN